MTALFVDRLSFFSLNPSGDIPIGGILGDFAFQSTRDLETVTCADFQIDLVGSIAGTDIPTACAIPEPSTLVLVLAGTGALGLLGYARRHRGRARGAM